MEAWSSGSDSAKGIMGTFDDGLTTGGAKFDDGMKNATEIAGNNLITGSQTASTNFSNWTNSLPQFLQNAINNNSVGSTAMAGGSSASTSVKTSGTTTTNSSGTTETWDPWMLAGKGANPSSYAEGTIATEATAGIFGEAGAEALVPLDNKQAGMKILRQILPLFADGGVVGTTSGSGTSPGATDSGTLTATFSLAGLVDMDEHIKDTLNDIQSAFRQTWMLINIDETQAWNAINANLQPQLAQVQTQLVTSSNLTKADITSIWSAMLTQTNVMATGLWPAVQPGLDLVRNNVVNGFVEMASAAITEIDTMRTTTASELGTMTTDWDTQWKDMNADLDTVNTSLGTTITQLENVINYINQLNSMSLNVGSGSSSSSSGSGSDYTGMGDESSGSSSLSSGQMVISGGLVNFADETCMGDTVLVNALTYTSPGGETSYINPMTYIDSGGISNYQGTASSTSSYSTGASESQLPAFLQGYADGGISTQAQMANVSEYGDPEIHLTKANVEEFLGVNQGGDKHFVFEIESERIGEVIFNSQMDKVRSVYGMSVK